MEEMNLWDDVVFIRRRIQEQVDYLNGLPIRKLDDKRFLELANSAFGVKKRFEDRLNELEPIKLNSHVS